MSTALKNAKGPAATGIAPDRGSNHPGKDKEMNKHSTTTGSSEKRARPTDAEILDAMEDVDAMIGDLRRATIVADEYATMEFRAGTSEGLRGQYRLTQEQVDGILYMLMHVRDLVREVEKATDKAYGREALA